MSCVGGIDQVVEIRPVGNQMKYELTEFRVKSGEVIKLVMINTATASVMKHNVMILKPGSDVNAIGELAIMAEGNIPTSEDIVAYTAVAEPQSQTEVTFTAPAPGRYPYICTYPGHYLLMKGVMIVE